MLFTDRLCTVASSCLKELVKDEGQCVFIGVTNNTIMPSYALSLVLSIDHHVNVI